MVFLASIRQEFITPIISATAVIAGSLIGAACSWFTTNYSMNKTIEVQNKVIEDNKRDQELEKSLKLCENVNIIRLDICNAIFQSIRILRHLYNKDYNKRYPIPINKDYSRVISSLTGKFNLKELSYIYQLYGILESLNKHINELKFNDIDGCNLVAIDCELLLHKLYGSYYKKVLELDIDNISYIELYNNEFIKEGYRSVLKKLDDNADFQDCIKNKSEGRSN